MSWKQIITTQVNLFLSSDRKSPAPRPQSITTANPFFGEQLINEINSVRVCLSASSLRPIPQQDRVVFLPYEMNEQQIAVRAWFDDDTASAVFIDKTLYDALSPDQRPYLWMHELLHGLILFEASIRAVRLESLVSYLFKHSDALNPQELKFQLESALITFEGREDFLVKKIHTGTVEQIQNLIALGADANLSHAIIEAVISGRADVVKALQKIADPNFMISEATDIFKDTTYRDDFDFTKRISNYCARKNVGPLYSQNPYFANLTTNQMAFIALGCTKNQLGAHYKEVLDALITFPRADLSSNFVFSDLHARNGDLVLVLLWFGAVDLAYDLYRSTLNIPRGNLELWQTWALEFSGKSKNKNPEYGPGISNELKKKYWEFYLATKKK